MPLKKKKATKPKKATKKKVVKRKAVKKLAPKRKALKRAKKKVPVKKPTKLKQNVIGIVTHYFPHVQAAVVAVKTPIAIGDVVKFKGHTTDFTQTIVSMQIDRKPITLAKKGDEIGLLVNSRVRQHDLVLKP